MSFDAFESVNAPYLARVYARGLVRESERGGLPLDFNAPTQLKSKLSNEVFLLKLIPGPTPDIYRMLPELNYRGVVLETVGTGGLHFLRRNLLTELKALSDRGVPVVACSQCLYETRDFTIYEVGRRLLECGVIPGLDMTTEAVVTKLMWSLGQSGSMEDIKQAFATNFVGEVTNP